MTLRDAVWNAVMKQIVKTGQFKISELPFEEAQRHTVRRVLREMEEMGWLSRESNQSAMWQSGEMAQLCLDIPSDKIR